MDKLKDFNRDRINVRKLINLTKKEKYFLKNSTYCNYLPLQKKVYNYYGAAENAREYLQEKLVGENDEKFIKILIKIINKVGKYYPTKKHIWLSVRVKNPYIEESVRWHWDGNYYGHNNNNDHSDDELHSKFIATLCGPQTFGINATQSDKEYYKTLRKQKFAGTITEEEFGQKLADRFNPKKININYSIIKVGKNNNSDECRQIHSEPVNTVPNIRRVFISILYGTEEEINLRY
jgi:hypothetical protein